jgi:NADH dehydrogenase FAD-containing subunit
MSGDSIFRVVVLGGNIAGLSVSHHLLREVLPKLSASPKFRYKLTLVTPNSHALWKVGIPRTLIRDEIKPVGDLFSPLEEPFMKQYGTEKFNLVQGIAVGLDEKDKIVKVRKTGAKEGTAGPQESIIYNALIVATGTTSKSPVWTLHGDHGETHKAVREVRSLLQTGKTVLIAGGGPASVESAGEIATHLPDKKITLLSGGDRVLPRLPENLSRAAVKRLSKLGVVVKDGLRVTEARKQPDSKTGESSGSTVIFSNGSQQTFDVYIDCTGGTPNSGFLPQKWLTAEGKMKTDEPTQRVEGVKGVYALGDIASSSRAGMFDSTFPKTALGYSLWEDFKEKDAMHMKEIRYTKHLPNTWLVPVGPSGGVGATLGWTVPSCLVWWLKCRTFFFEQFGPLVQGNGH